MDSCQFWQSLSGGPSCGGRAADQATIRSIPVRLALSGFDRERWAEITVATDAELVAVERELHALLPAPARKAILFGDTESGLNLWSPVQVKDALGRLGVALSSTDKHHLKAHDHRRPGGASGTGN